MYRVIGYYVCEIMTCNRPDESGDRMISVSGCFGGIHPDLSCCFFEENREDECEEYCAKWNLNREKLGQLKWDIGKLFDHRLGIDGRFLSKADAEYFAQTYFSENECVVVCVSTTDEYYDVLKKEFIETGIANNNILSYDLDESQLLGFDILGWDISGFHTFLCNNLQSILPSVRFNAINLLDNDFEEVKGFARQIQGKGEPVEWIPCRIGKCC